MKPFIRFVSNPHISLAFRFEPYRRKEEDVYTLRFTIATATPLFGYNEKGELEDSEKFVFIDENSQQVDEFEDALILAEGSVFPAMHPELHAKDGVDFFISFYSTVAMFRREFDSFSSLITGDFLSQIYKEFHEAQLHLLEESTDGIKI